MGTFGNVGKYDFNLERKKGLEMAKPQEPVAPAPQAPISMPAPSMPMPTPAPKAPTPALEGLQQAAYAMPQDQTPVGDFVGGPGSLRQDIGQRMRPSLAALQGLRY